MKRLLKPVAPAEVHEDTNVMPRFMAFLDRCQGMITRFGVDYASFRLIVGTKFLLATREKVGVGIQLNQKASTSQHTLRNSFMLNLLMGAFLALMLFLVPVPIYAFTTFFGTMFVMVFLTMLTNYSGLMLDPRDRLLYTVRGVSDRTMNAARLTVVGFYLTLNVVALGLPGVIIAGIQPQFGVMAAIGMMVSLLIMALFTYMLALFIYLVVLRLFDGEMLKNILNLVQIAMIIGIYLASQILPRISVSAAFMHVGTPHLVWYEIFAVPMWFAGLPLLFMGQFNTLSFVMTGLSIVATVVLTITFVHMAPQFEQYLAKLENSGTGRRKQSLYFRLTQRLFARTQMERTYYDFGWHILREEREFKLRVYPQLAYSLVIPVVFMFSFSEGGLQSGLTIAKYFGPYAILAFAMAIPIAVYSLGFSSQPDAMRLFQRVPFEQQGFLLRGIVKAMFVRLLLPLMLILTLVFTIWGGLNALLASSAMMMLTYAVALFAGSVMDKSSLPFSRDFDPNRNAGGTATLVLTLPIMAIMMVIIIVGGIFHNPIIAGGLLLVGGVAAFLLSGTYKNVRFDPRWG